MKNARITEHPGHFVVDEGDGKPYRVPKDRLAHKTVLKIQKLACGGKVQGYADGGVVTDPFPQADDPFTLLGIPKPPDAAPPPVSGGVIPAVLPPELADQHAPFAPITPPAPTPFHNVQLEQPPAPPVPKPPPSAADTIASATQQAQAAQAQKGAVEQAGFSNISDTQQTLANDMARAHEESQKMFAENQAAQDRLFTELQDPKSNVTPEHFWATRSTGQKVSAAIGLILGGIGAGLTKGPNYAMQIIDGAINRDMEAQKLNLGKKESLLSRLMAKGHDLLTAEALTRGYLQTTAAAQIAAQTSSMQSGIAQPAAQAAIAELRAKGAQAVQQATQTDLQIRTQKIELAMSAQHAEALGELMKGVSGGGGFDRRILDLPGMKEYRERAVDLPDGTIAMAADKEEAGKVKESMAAVSRIRAKVQRMNDLLQNGNPATMDRGTAQAAYDDLLAEMGHLHDLNRLSDKDLEIFQGQVPKITDFIKPFAKQKLAGLGKSIDDKVWSVNQTFLHRPTARRPGG